MSDPLRNAEIEDVLSSIRRLVAQDRERAEKGPEAPRADSRFVLTPAHRVPDPETPDETETRGESGAPGESGGETQDGANQGARARPAPEPAPEPAPGPSAEPSAGSVPGKGRLSLLGQVGAPEDLEETLERRIAELEAAIHEAAGEWEPDGGETEADEPDSPSLRSRFSFRRGGAADAGDTGGAPARGGMPGNDPGDALGDDPAPEERSSFASARPGPDAAGGADDPARDARASDAAAAPEATGTTAADGVGRTAARGAEKDAEKDAEAAEETGASWFAAEGPAPDRAEAEDEALIDEETLRRMVAELVREELQGVLGERITRNIRRLVRREIQRALSLRDLDDA